VRGSDRLRSALTHDVAQAIRSEPQECAQEQGTENGGRKAGLESNALRHGLTAETVTFATQMEALKRYRTGGEQKVTVQHVSVSEGGQTIVGNVTHAARERAPEKVANSTVALPDAREPPMSTPE
jgi:hypothetical protein